MKSSRDQLALMAKAEAEKHLSEIEKELDQPEDYITEAIQHCEIKSTDKISRPVICLEIQSKNGYTTIGTFGNFGCAIGKAKSRKSGLCALFASAMVANGQVENVRASMPLDKGVVLYIDTEQEKYHVLQATKRISRLAGYAEDEHPKNLKVLGLRKYPPNRRLAIIEYLIENTENLGAVIIDGIRDLVNSINDEEEATKVTSKLLKWTEEKGIYLLTVLHQNKGDGNARGHLGTEIVNKGETVISVTKLEDDNLVSEVKSEFARNMDFEPFVFGFDENILPYIKEGYIKKTKTSKSTTVEPADFESTIHIKYLKEIFLADNKREYKRDLSTREMHSLIHKVFTNQGHKVSLSKARAFLQYQETEGFVVDRSERQERKASKYCLNDKYNDLKLGSFEY
ncbi:AAA family ATPase [Catalinimonas sp. 4WD22]|uniref:AAA family ATPase n=1 Tax=Catalinimonas locisalis TaxID=3133978 RepID=UPI0031013B97